MLAFAFFGQAGQVQAQDAGAQLAMACGSCHGLNGGGGETIPPLAGRDKSELLEQMRALKEPHEGVTIMPRILRAYDDDELKALAGHFARMEP
nr:c-type cytochrome [Pseudaminobacter soli]